MRAVVDDERLDVVSYLESKGLKGKRSSGPEVVYPCFMGCQEPKDSRKRRFYVNTETGFYICFVCGASGGSHLLQRHFGDAQPTGVEHRDVSQRRREILEEATARAQAMLMNNDNLLMYLLDERGLTEETIRSRQLGWVGNRWSLVADLPASNEELLATGLVKRDDPRQDFFYAHLMIPYLQLGTVVQLRGKCLSGQMAGRYMTGPGEHVYLYNTDSLHGADEVLITEGEFDAMTVQQHLSVAPDRRTRSLAVVGLAGVSAVPDDFDEWLSNARRVFIGFDSDTPGKIAAVKLAERIGARARIVTLPEGKAKCDWSEFLLSVPTTITDEWHVKHPYAGHGWSDVMELLSNVGGRRLFTIGESGRSLREQRALVPGVKTGFEQLDEVIAPGIQPGQLMITLSKTGVGKTVWLANVARANRGRPTLLVSMEQTKEEFYDRLARVERFWTPRASDVDIDETFANLLICDENRIPDGDLGALVAEYEMEMGCRPELLLVDYLGYYARGIRLPGSRYESVSEAVMMLKEQAKTQRIATIAPHQVGRQNEMGRPIDVDDARDTGVIEETADFLTSLYRPGMAVTEEENKEPDAVVRQGLLKSRHGGAGRTFSLVFDYLTLAMVDVTNPAAARARHHTYESWRGQTYADLRRTETQPLQTTMAVA